MTLVAVVCCEVHYVFVLITRWNSVPVFFKRWIFSECFLGRFFDSVISGAGFSSLILPFVKLKHFLSLKFHLSNFIILIFLSLILIHLMLLWPIFISFYYWWHNIDLNFIICRSFWENKEKTHLAIFDNHILLFTFQKYLHLT